MKKLLSLALLFWALASLASVQVQPGLTLTHGSQSYTIQYVNTEYTVRDTFLIGPEGGHAYSSVNYINDYYDYVGEEGRPMYPAYTLFLQLPKGATNVQLQVISKHTTNVTLNNDYIPVQLSSEDSTYSVHYDNTFYANSDSIESYYHNYFKINGSYSRYKSTGTNVSIYPVHYHYGRTATVITDAIIRVTYDGDPLGSLYTSVDIIDATFFDNYLDRQYYQPTTTPIINGDEYLIITENKYANEIQMFKNFKTSLGYNVSVVYVEEIGNDPVQIRNSIKSHFYRPQGLRYVLLAGDIRNIPYSSGNHKEYFNVYTDILYSCIGSSDITKQSDFHSDVLVGRWCVNNSTELMNIIQKTIKAEQSSRINTLKRMHVFAGTDKNDFTTRAKYIRDKVIIPSSYIIGNITTNTSANLPPSNPYYDIQVELQDAEIPLWMFLYFGSCNNNVLTPPYQFRSEDINSCVNNTHPFQPYAFIFTDRAGYFVDTISFANRWIKGVNGGIGILSASESTYSECDKWLAYKMFRPLKNQDANVTIGQFTTSAKEKYYYADRVLYRKKHIAKYNYLGDPSLYVQGLYLLSQQNQAPKKIYNDTEVEPAKVRVYTTSGLLLIETDYNSFDMNMLHDGVVVVQLLDKENNTLSIQKILK